MAYSQEEIRKAKEFIIEKICDGESLKSILDNNRGLLPTRPIIYEWLNESSHKYDAEFLNNYYSMIGSTKQQQSKFCKSNPKGSKAKNQDDYRVVNASNTNRKRFPVSSVYLMKIKNTNYYKIGVSQNINRRHRDLQNSMPFYVEILKVKQVFMPYDLEDFLHLKYSEYYIKNEWFELDGFDELCIIKYINEWHTQKKK